RAVGHHDELTTLDTEVLAQPPLRLIYCARVGLDIDVVHASHAEPPPRGAARRQLRSDALVLRPSPLNVVVELEGMLAKRDEEPDRCATPGFVTDGQFEYLDSLLLELDLEPLHVLWAFHPEA